MKIQLSLFILVSNGTVLSASLSMGVITSQEVLRVEETSKLVLGGKDSAL